MKRQLSIRNFGPIQSAQIELRDFNIFIGEQGSGKSSIAKLMAICNQGATERKQNLTKVKSLLEEYNINSYLNADTDIHYKWKEGETILRGFNAISDLHSQESPDDPYRVLYIPAERFFVSTFSRSLATLVLNKTPIPTTLLEFASLYEKAKKKYPNYNAPMFNLTFKTSETGEMLHLQDSDKYIPFKDASSGIQSVIPLLMVIDYATSEQLYDRFIIEEPELNLFPQAQVDLLHFLVSHCHQLTVTTHSPYLLSGLNNLIEAGNVLKLHPDKKEEISTLIPEACLIDFDNISAYKIEKGEVFSIMDNEYHLITADKIDEISDKESRVFSTLLEME